MPLFRRHEVDDVDVESCLENLDRVDDFVDLPRWRSVIDLRRREAADAIRLDERADELVEAPRR